MKRPFTLILLAALCSFAFAAPPTVKTESFDRDPAWDAYNNHVTPKKLPTIHQDFGYSTTHFAGKAAGEIGGQIQRSATPASYAAAIKPLTLDDPLSASGSCPVCVTAHGYAAKLEKAPLLIPGKTLDWSLTYDPAANHDNGQIIVTLGKESATLPLKPNQKPDNATFNRFGLFTIPIGGQMIKIYLDDLTYTSVKP